MRLRIHSDNPYREVICSCLSGALPSVHIERTETIVDVLTQEMVGTKRVRFGPTPNPESLAAIRAVIRHAVESQLPIALLLPWGSKKPRNGYSVDLAEMMALKMVACFIERISKYHLPGVDLVVRIEDLSGWYLFESEGSEALDSSRRYVADLLKLFSIMEIPGVHPWLESEHIDRHRYDEHVRTLEPIFGEYLTTTDNGDGSSPAFAKLATYGWKGLIPAAQRQFYYSRYERFYPALDDSGRRRQLAKYFATVLARVLVQGRGTRESWKNNFIDFTFHPPVPESTGLVDRRLYYRTLPTDYTRDHIPPWRARGYLRIVGREATPKLAHWDNTDFETVPVILSGNNDILTVQSEYLVDD